MNEQSEQPFAGDGSEDPARAANISEPTLAEDILLLLFQPDSGTIAGEGTLFYVLGGAVLADLALDEQVTAAEVGIGHVEVKAAEGRAPEDGLLRPAWEYVADRPREVQGLLAAIGPTLRGPVLDRLVERDEIRRVKRKALGLFPTTALVDGATGRRARLLSEIRRVLVDRADPTPRLAALAALLWASGSLPLFDRDIPWTSTVLTRAQELERGNWGAGAASLAVTRTMTMIIASSVIVQAAARPRD